MYIIESLSYIRVMLWLPIPSPWNRNPLKIVLRRSSKYAL